MIAIDLDRQHRCRQTVAFDAPLFEFGGDPCAQLDQRVLVLIRTFDLDEEVEGNEVDEFTGRCVD